MCPLACPCSASVAHSLPTVDEMVRSLAASGDVYVQPRNILLSELLLNASRDRGMVVSQAAPGADVARLISDWQAGFTELEGFMMKWALGNGILGTAA